MGKRVFKEIKRIVDILSTNAPLLVYDVETTGLHSDKGDRVIQFAGILFENHNGQYSRVDQLNIYINPGFPISTKITELTGITNEQLAGAHNEDVAFAKIKSLFDRAGIVSGYNVKFDNGFMKDLFMRQGEVFNPPNIVDPYIGAKELVNPEELPDGKRTLENIARYYGVQKEGFHNAFVDVINTVQVLFAEVRDYLNNQEPLSNEKKFVAYVERLKYSRQNDFLYIHLYGDETVRYNLYKGEFDDTPVAFDANDIYRQADEWAKRRGFVSVERMRAR